MEKFYSKMHILQGLHGITRLETLSSDVLSAYQEQMHCPACGCISDWKTLVAIGGDTLEKANTLVCCKQCAHVSYRYVPTPEWLDDYYDKRWDQFGRDIDKGKKDETNAPPDSTWLHLLDLPIDKNWKILDYGCGFGKDLRALSALGFKNLFGVDQSRHRATLAAERFPGQVEVGGLDATSALTQKHGLFDVIVSRHTFEHLLDPFSVANELKKFLSPTGFLLVITPDIYTESPISTALFFPHLHLFNRTSMMRLMKRAGLSPFVWQKTKSELVILASKDPHWQPPAPAFSSQELTINEDFLNCLSEFICKPWELVGAAKKFYAYMAPYKSSRNTSGFYEMQGVASYWASVVGFLSNRISSFRSPQGVYRLTRLLRMVCGKEAIGSGITFIGVKKVAQSAVPWITTSNGGIPVLIK